MAWVHDPWASQTTLSLSSCCLLHCGGPNARLHLSKTSLLKYTGLLSPDLASRWAIMGMIPDFIHIDNVDNVPKFTQCTL